VTLEDLKAYKKERDGIKDAIDVTKQKLKKHLELLPFLIANEHVEQLKLQLDHESKFQNQHISLDVYKTN